VLTTINVGDGVKNGKNSFTYVIYGSDSTLLVISIAKEPTIFYMFLLTHCGFDLARFGYAEADTADTSIFKAAVALLNKISTKKFFGLCQKSMSKST
jgi:hypothetical protein